MSDIHNLMIISTVPVINKRIGDYNKKYASGFFLKYKDLYFFLTVAHVREKESDDIVIEDYLVESDNVPGGMTAHSLSIPHNQILQIKNVDLLIIPMQADIKCKYQLAKEVNGKPVVVGSVDVNKLKDDLTTEVNKEEEYCFGGRTQNQACNDKAYNYVLYNTVAYGGAKFTHFDVDETRGKVIHFASKDNETMENFFFQGCSGAPIFDFQGNLVSMVLCADDENKGFYGLYLSAYKTIFDHIVTYWPNIPVSEIRP